MPSGTKCHHLGRASQRGKGAERYEEKDITGLGVIDGQQVLQTRLISGVLIASIPERVEQRIDTKNSAP